jgi:Tfp pilus assembly PilM family ATPase
MIKLRKLLFPTVIADHRIFAEHFLGIHIGESFVRATLIKNTGYKKIIERVIDIDFLGEMILDVEGHVAEAFLIDALTKIYKQVGTVDKIIISLPANLFVFKDLEMPFSQDEKIRMVLGYEAEPLLPFPAESCVLDFIKLQTATTASCKIMVCAIQKNILNSIKSAVEKTKIKPDNITVDLVSLYDLCNQVEPQIENNYSIISISENWTKVGLVDKGLLRFVKNIPTGTRTIIEEISKLDNILPEQAKKILENDLELLAENEVVYKQVQKIILGLAKKVQFAIQSFNSKAENPAGIEKIIVFEEKTPLPSFFKICGQQMNVSCQPFSVDKMLAQGKILNRASYRASSIYYNAIALSSSVVSSQLEKFDLGRSIVSKSQQELIQQQVCATLVIACLIFSYIFVSASFKNSQIRGTSSEIEQFIREKTTGSLLPNEVRLPRKASAKQLLDEATTYVENLKNSWQAHGNDDLKPLEVMLDLTRLMDRTKIDIRVSKLKLSYDQQFKRVIELQGSFKKGTADKDFKKLVTQISNIKKFANIKVNEEEFPDLVKFSIQAYLEL